MSSQLSTAADIVFDPYDHLLQDDPYPTYARLRREDPFHHNIEHDFWVISRHADVHSAVRQDSAYSSAMGVSMDASAWNENAHMVMSFLAMDPPRQTRLRRLVSKGFTPRRVKELAPSIQRLTEGYLDQIFEAGKEVTFDWIGELAGKVPMDVISEMLGVPEADRDEVRRLADLLVVREDGLRDVPPAGMHASLELLDYFREHVARRHRVPTDDLTTALIAAEDEGDRMTDHEVIGFLFLMVVAGNETTTKLLGNALWHLTSHPEQRDRVFADKELIRPWIEETLRYDASSQLFARHLVEDVTLHGVTAPAGSKVLLAVGSANHDEDVFTDSERFTIDRSDEELAQSLSFGGGRHFCLGANLARLEARIVLNELVDRVRTLEVDHDACQRFYSASVRGFARVPVRMELR
ncbi:MAG TPA: cytochrome P450 [Nocardioidaceae bacterium]|nr:cytochrome P450 [Nocardioidaceae bacterium]